MTEISEFSKTVPQDILKPNILCFTNISWNTVIHFSFLIMLVSLIKIVQSYDLKYQMHASDIVDF